MVTIKHQKKTYRKLNKPISRSVYNSEHTQESYFLGKQPNSLIPQYIRFSRNSTIAIDHL